MIPVSGRFPWRRDRLHTPVFLASLVAQMVKNPLAIMQTWVQSLGYDDPLEEGMATHSSILTWRISSGESPCTNVPGRRQFIGPQGWTQLSA